MEPAIRQQYDDDKYFYNPHQLWKLQYQHQVCREGAHLLMVLDNCQLVDYLSCGTKRRTLFIVGARSRYLHDSFGPAICSLSSRDSGGDLAEVAGPAAPLLRTFPLWNGFLLRIRLDLAICDIKIQGEHRRHFMKDLPKGTDWGPFLTALELANNLSSSETGQSIAGLS